MSMDMHSAEASQTPSAHAADNVSSSDPTSYFAYQEHVGSIIAHIGLMVLAWFFVLPLGKYRPINERGRLRILICAVVNK
jgi:hypothetical protein